MFFTSINGIVREKKAFLLAGLYSVLRNLSVIDTHSHIDLPLFDDDFQVVLAAAREAGVSAQVLPGVIRNGWERILALSAAETDLFAAIGLHPMYLSQHREGDLAALRDIACGGGLVALGEIGLDYYIRDGDRKGQQELFEAQIDIAKEASLPLLLHVRKAHDQVQSILRRKNFDGGGIVHAFSGSLQQAEHYIKLGFMISICGTVTYDRASRIRSVATALPLTALVLETDSPDIPPASRHGERNTPANIVETAMILAQLRGESFDTIVVQTSANARQVLDL